MKLLADLFHMNIEEANLADALRAAGPHIGHVHFADSNRRAAGMGHTDFAPVVAALREIGYAGYLSAEVLPLPDRDAAAKQTIESVPESGTPRAAGRPSRSRTTSTFASATRACFRLRAWRHDSGGLNGPQSSANFSTNSPAAVAAGIVSGAAVTPFQCRGTTASTVAAPVRFLLAGDLHAQPHLAAGPPARSPLPSSSPAGPGRRPRSSAGSARPS